MKVILLIAFIGFTTTTAEENPSLREFQHGNVKFSAKLYQEILKSKKNNFVFSPFSAEVVLALTQAGARDTTAQEFTTAVNLPANQETTRNAFKSIFPSFKTTTENFKLSSANKLYVAQNFTILDSYKDLAVTVYDSEVENIDFAKKKPAADKINSWIEEKTHHRIKNLIDEASLNAATALVLVNALYFKARWANEFEKQLTTKENFYSTPQDPVKVDMMSLVDDFNYYECKKKNAKFLELPYLGAGVSMTIILPNDQEGLRKWEEENLLEEVIKEHPLENARVAVKLPKWKTESEIDLKPILQELGLKAIFNPETADLGGITGGKDLYVNEVKQKTFIAVDEAGTEAAAATFHHLSERGDIVWEKTETFVVDRPFVYLIKSNEVVLMLGRVSSF